MEIAIHGEGGQSFFSEVVNRSFSFAGTGLVAKPWVLSFTRTELWDELEKLADANPQHFHEGSSRNPPKGGNAKHVNNTESKDCAIFLSFGHTNRAKSHSTENRRWNMTDAETVATEASTDLPKAPVKKVDENRQSTPSVKGKGSKGQQTSGGKEKKAHPAKEALQKIVKMEMVRPILPKVIVEKAIFPREKANPVANSRESSKGMSAGKGKGTSLGTKRGQAKGSSGQQNPHSGRGASVHQVAGSDEDYYNKVTTKGWVTPMEKGI